MFKKYILPLLFLVLTYTTTFAQHEQLREQIALIAKSAKGIVGISVLGLENRDTLNYNGNARLVMQSVIKLPIAMAVLHLVDTNLLSLTNIIHVKKKDLPQMYSPLRDKYPDGTDISLGDLLGYMVSQSDGDACDILLDQLGGPDQVEDYLLHSVKIKGINIAASEADMHKSWEAQYTDWCKPASIIKLLDTLYNGKALMPPTRDFLLKLMTAATTGPNRIKGLLPAGTVVAHKTGSSDTNDMGLTPATNDAGIVTLPNGKHFAIAVFVCNSTADMATRDGVIAKITKAVYDYEAAR
jgi:beta-lactamase class A